MSVAISPGDSQQDQEQDEFEKVINASYGPEEREALNEESKKLDDRGSEEELEDLYNKTGGGSDSSDNDTVGSGYTPNAKPSRNLRVRLKDRKKIVAASIVVGFLTVIASLLMFLPLKVLHIVDNLQSRYYASANSALQNETDNLVDHYIAKHVLPGIQKNKCRGTIDRNCKYIVDSKGLVGNLYKGWRQAKFETQLAEKYGLEFSYNSAQQKFYLKMPNNVLIDVTSAPKEGSVLKVLESRGEARAAYLKATQKATEDLTLWKRTYIRIKVRRYLVQKNLLHSCVITCKSGLNKPFDNFKDWKDKKKKAAVLAVTQRVLRPNDEMVDWLVKCVFEQCDLTPKPGIINVGLDGCTSNCLDNGRPLSASEKDLISRITSIATSEGLDTAGKRLAAENLYQEISDKGFKQYITEKTVRKAMEQLGISKGTSEVENKAVAQAIAERTLIVIGFLAFIGSMADTAQFADDWLPKLMYIMNTSAMAEMWGTYRTYADETKSGKVDAEITGSFFESLGTGDHNPEHPNDKILGGTAGAEQSPLWSILLGDGSGEGAANYICANGKTVNKGKYICDEEKASPAFSGQSVLDAIAKTLSPFGFIYRITIKPFITLIMKSLSYLGITGVANAIMGLVAKLIPIDQVFKGMIDMVVKNILPPPIVGTNMSGARTFNVVAGGADFTGNEMAHYQLGGVKLDQKQQSAILNEQQQYELDKYQQKTFLARMFDTESQYSPTSKLVLAMPSSSGGAISSMASILNDPLGKISRTFGSFLHLGRVQAATVFEDPFGISQYGYPLDSPVFKQDPEDFWIKNCSTSAVTDAYNARAAEKGNWNPKTKMPENKYDPSQPFQGTNPCALIQAAVGSAGAIFTDSVLSPEEKIGSSGGSTLPEENDNGGTPTPPTDNSPDDQNPEGTDESSTPCDARTVDMGVKQGFEANQPKKIRLCKLTNLPSDSDESLPGSPFYIQGADGKALVNASVSTNFYDLVEAAHSAGKVAKATSTFRTMAHQQYLYDCYQSKLCNNGNEAARPGYSNHQMGVAVDFGISGISNSKSNCIYVAGICTATGYPDWEWLNANSTRFGLYQYSGEFWHFSPTGH